MPINLSTPDAYFRFWLAVAVTWTVVGAAIVGLLGWAVYLLTLLVRRS